MKTKEETKTVEQYEQKIYGDVKAVRAEVTSYQGGSLSIDLGDSDGIPFGSFSNMDREKAAALHKLLGEILKDHKA